MAPRVYTLSELRNPPAYTDVKEDVLTRMELAGFTSIRSFAPESLPVAMVETDAQATDDMNQAAKYIVEAGYNSTAADEALTELADEVYLNDRRPGLVARGFVVLTDGGLGPYSFDPTSLSFTTGIGGRVFNGRVINDVDSITLPLNGTCRVYVEAEDTGSAYNLPVGTLVEFGRGTLAGVTLTNPIGWQADQYGQSGTVDEKDPLLQERNRRQWETLSIGATPGSYIKRILDVDQQITRVRTFTNLDLTDPGLLTAFIAGDAGAVSGSVVAKVQQTIAPNLLGGANQTETAKFVCVSAVNLPVTLGGVVVVDSTLATQSFLDQLNADVMMFFSTFLIGGGKLGRISWERVVGILSYRAGLTNEIVLDATNITLNGGQQDLPVQYFQVPVLSSTLQLQAL